MAYQTEEDTLLRLASEWGAESVAIKVAGSMTDRVRYHVEVMMPGQDWYESPLHAWGYSIEAACDAVSSCVKGYVTQEADNGKT